MMTSLKKQHGATIVELMIYMVVGLIVIGLALRSMSQLARDYVHSRTVAQVQYNGRDAASALARDIASMGFKHYLTPAVPSTPPVPQRIEWDSAAITGTRVYASGAEPTNGEQNASFLFTHNPGTLKDELEIFRIRVGDEGQHQRTERVKYNVNTNNELRREVRVFNQAVFTADSTTAVTNGLPIPSGETYWMVQSAEELILAENVMALAFRFSQSGAETAGSWVNIFPAALGGWLRNEARHIEITLLVKASRKSDIVAARATYSVGDYTYTPPAEDTHRVHRLYRHLVEIPSNGRI